MLERTGVSPLAQRGLDEALSLAVGLRSVGSSSDVAKVKGSEIRNKSLRLIARPVVTHDTPGSDAQRGEVNQGALKEGDGTLSRFIGHDLGKSEA